MKTWGRQARSGSLRDLNHLTLILLSQIRQTELSGFNSHTSYLKPPFSG